MTSDLRLNLLAPDDPAIAGSISPTTTNDVVEPHLGQSIRHGYRLVQFAKVQIGDDDIFYSGDGRLSYVYVELGETDRASNCRFEVADPHLEIAGKYFLLSYESGGIQVPPELLEDEEQKASSESSGATGDGPRSGGSLSNSEQIIIEECINQGVTDLHQIAYVLATAQHESDSFNTLEEYASGAAYEGRSNLGNTQPGDGKRFKGRGYVQLTGRANYERYAEILGEDIVSNPEMLEENPRTSAYILVHGMRTDNFAQRGTSLDHYGSGSSFDFIGARRLVNGNDRAGHIAGIAEKYVERLKTGDLKDTLEAARGGSSSSATAENADDEDEEEDERTGAGTAIYEALGGDRQDDDDDSDDEEDEDEDEDGDDEDDEDSEGGSDEDADGPSTTTEETVKGTEIIIELGENPYQTVRYHFIHTGTSAQGRLPDTTSFDGQCVRWLMSRRKKNRTYENITFRELAEQVAANYGLELEMEGGEQATYQFLDQTGISDLRLLIREARALGYTVADTGRTLILKPTRPEFTGFVIDPYLQAELRFTDQAQREQLSAPGVYDTASESDTTTGEPNSEVDRESGEVEETDNSSEESAGLGAEGSGASVPGDGQAVLHGTRQRQPDGDRQEERQGIGTTLYEGLFGGQTAENSLLEQVGRISKELFEGAVQQAEESDADVTDEDGDEDEDEDGDEDGADSNVDSRTGLPHQNLGTIDLSDGEAEAQEIRDASRLVKGYVSSAKIPLVSAALTIAPGNLIGVAKTCFNNDMARDAFGREWRVSNIKFEMSTNSSSCAIDFYTPQAQSSGSSGDSGGDGSDSSEARDVDGCTVVSPAVYLSQRENANNPSSTCNVTSLAIVLQSMGITDDSPDDIYEAMLSQGLNNKDSGQLASYANSAYDRNFRFDPAATMQGIRDSIDEGKPVVGAAYFTAGDHLVAIVGYCGEEEFVCNDPWGDWNNGESAYQDTNGELVKYKLSALAGISFHDGDAWVIFPD